ncbi:MAG: carbonic anhydrase [Verrucomicrobiota bacterium]
MRLFESIIDANHRAVAGDASAGLHPAEFADALPIVALTCVDPRLNAFFPNVLALPAEDFIWLRNAGNIITGTLSSTMRSLALSCAVKGGREIAVIGHTDCQICRTTTMQLLDKLKALGVDRNRLPENINEFFGTFGSERQNVIKACDFIRNSPLIGPKIPVHGLLLDLETGKLEWLVNGYETMQSQQPGVPGQAAPPKFGDLTESLGAFKDFTIGEMKFPETKIGEMAASIENMVSQELGRPAAQIGQQIAPAAESSAQAAGQVAHVPEPNWPKTPLIRMKPSPQPPLKKNPLPPPIRPHADIRRG